MAESESSEGLSTGIIIAIVVVSLFGLMCCGCAALAWVFGDFAVEIIEQFAAITAYA